MSEEEDADLDTWVAKTPSAKDALCDIEVIQQFASWLCHFAKKSEKQYHGEPLGLRSIQDMLSSIKSVFNKIFAKSSIFGGGVDQLWYTNLMVKSLQEITRIDMKRGVLSSNKSKPIGREQLKSVNETSLPMNSYAAIRKAVYVRTTFNSAGRSGEAAYTCIDNGAYWDYDEEKFYINQKEIKVGEEKNNDYVSDSKYYVLDQYWLFFIYYITGEERTSLDQTTVMETSYSQSFTTKIADLKEQLQLMYLQYLKILCVQKATRGKWSHLSCGIAQ